MVNFESAIKIFRQYELLEKAFNTFGENLKEFVDRMEANGPYLRIDNVPNEENTINIMGALVRYSMQITNLKQHKLVGVISFYKESGSEEEILLRFCFDHLSNAYIDDITKPYQNPINYDDFMSEYLVPKLVFGFFKSINIEQPLS